MLLTSFCQRVDVVISWVVSSSPFNGARVMLHPLPCGLLGGLRTTVVTVVWDSLHYSSLEQFGRGSRGGEPGGQAWDCTLWLAVLLGARTDCSTGTPRTYRQRTPFLAVVGWFGLVWSWWREE